MLWCTAFFVFTGAPPLHLRKNPKKPAVSWHTTLHAKCSVLYLLWALTLERCCPPAGQCLACGMRAGGFCGQVPRKHRALQEQKPPDREELGQECLQPCGRLPASTSHKRDTHPAAADHSHGSRASRVSFGSLSLSQPRRYAMAFPANTLVRMVSPSASRMIRAVPFSKSNTISPHSPSQSA